MKHVSPAAPAPSGPLPTPLECVTFFNQALERFPQAACACGETDERLIQIDDLVLRLTFAGSTLSPRLMRELEHRALPPSFPAAPAFTLYVWDDASTHTRMPPPPWLGYDAYTRRGDLRGWNTERIYTAYRYDVATISAMDVKQKMAFFWTRAASNLPDYEISAPLRILLHWIGNLHGAQLVHGGAVGTTQRGVLLVGKGGSGKSTTVLSCLTSNLLYVGDNYCWLKAAPVPSIHSVYSSARVHADNLARLPHMLPSLGNANNLATEKATFFLHEQARPHDFVLAMREFRRVLKPAGTLLLTVPFGKYRNLVTQQVFDTARLEQAIDAFKPQHVTRQFYAYSESGWQIADGEQCGQCEYVDWIATLIEWRPPNFPVQPDGAVAARAVACLKLVKPNEPW